MSIAKYDWDEQNIAHIARHEVTPGEFEQIVSNDPTFLYTHTDEQSGEERMVYVGHTNALRILVIVWTLRNDLIRPVTVYRPSRQIRSAYLGKELQ